MALLLLLVLPLQGLAAVLMPFHCLTDEHHSQIVVSAHQPDQSMAHDHHDKSSVAARNDGPPSDSEAGHLSCHHVCTGAPSMVVLTVPDAPFVSINQISSVLPPFFPERLLRPPRT